MQLTFEKQLIKTGAIWGDNYKSKYSLMDTTDKVIAQLEYLNSSASFWYEENYFVIQPENKVFGTKYLLFVENQENPIAEIKAWEGWTFIKPYVQFRDGEKYIFHKLKHTSKESFWSRYKKEYKVCLKKEEHAIIYDFTKSPRTINDDFGDFQQYRNLKGIATFQENNYCVMLVGLFLIERMLYEEDDI